MNQPQTQTNDVARLYPNPMPRTESLVNKSIETEDGAFLTEDLHTLSRQLEQELTEKTNEVAMLRELLNRNGDELNNFHHTKEEAFAHAEKAMPLWECVVIKRNTSDVLLFLGGWKVTTSGKLAPAPEEAHEGYAGYDYLPQPNHDLVHRTPAPEESCKCGYGPHWNEWNGVCSDCGRTRRPLPNREMPLGLASMMECFMGDYPDAGKAIYDAIYNLRDEIEQLKKNQK
jgi:hypothetical protein